jgi:hypothetical protein
MSTVLINVKQLPYYFGTKSLDGSTYKLSIHWNTDNEKWYLSLEGLNNTVDIKGIALLCGKDLLAPFGYYELGELWVIDNSGANEDPDYLEFGTRWTLEYTPVAD